MNSSWNSITRGYGIYTEGGSGVKVKLTLNMLSAMSHERSWVHETLLEEPWRKEHGQYCLISMLRADTINMAKKSGINLSQQEVTAKVNPQIDWNIEELQKGKKQSLDKWRNGAYKWISASLNMNKCSGYVITLCHMYVM